MSDRECGLFLFGDAVQHVQGKEKTPNHINADHHTTVSRAVSTSGDRRLRNLQFPYENLSQTPPPGL
jgi:hypothetical protein